MADYTVRITASLWVAGSGWAYQGDCLDCVVVQAETPEDAATIDWQDYLTGSGLADPPAPRGDLDDIRYDVDVYPGLIHDPLDFPVPLVHAETWLSDIDFG